MGLTFLGRLMIAIGLFIALGGLLILGLGRIRIGPLPGDLVIKHGQTTYFFPLATCLLISVVVSIVLTLIARSRH